MRINATVVSVNVDGKDSNIVVRTQEKAYGQTEGVELKSLNSRQVEKIL